MQDGLPEAPSQICPVCVRNAVNSFAHLLRLLALTFLCLAEFISWDLVQPLVLPAKLAPSAPSSPDDVDVVRVRPGGFVLQMPPCDSTSDLPYLSRLANNTLRYVPSQFVLQTLF